MNVRNVLPRDAIRSIDHPSFGSTYGGDPHDEVIVVDGDPARAYPIRFLSYHEIVNDVVDGRPLAVTWCPICWSAAVDERTIDGRTLTFGVSGKLADDALVMYDRETGSEWHQPTGRAIEGPLTGERPNPVAAPMMPWRRFHEDHPEGIVLGPVYGEDSRGVPSVRNVYDMQPYERYVNSDAFGLFGMRGEGEPRSWDRDDLDAKTPVLGIEHGGAAVGYPVPWVDADGGFVAGTVGGLDVVVVSADGGIHAFEHPGLAFERRDGSLVADGTSWDGVTGTGADGRALSRVPSRRMFAFAWQDAHGADAFYR